MQSKNSSEHAKNAKEYDSLSGQYEWYGGEVLFGLVFEYISAGDKLLDLGIGTGLGSIPFHKAGLKIYGIDNSEEMLDVCREKGISQNLKTYDLSEDKLLYDNNEFNHIISCGVFHFFADLEHFFSESHRILVPNGTFSFIVQNSNDDISETVDEEYGIPVYGHSEIYIERLVEKYNFELLKKQSFSALKNLSGKEKFYFKAYILKKMNLKSSF